MWLSPETFLVLILATAALLPLVPFLILYLLCCWIVLAYIENFTSSISPVILLLLLFPLGVLFALNNEGYDISKDVWYLSKIVILFSAGFTLASRIRNINSFFEMYVAVSVIVSILYLVRFFFLSGQAGSESGLDIAYEVGYMNLTTVFALPLLIRQSKYFIFIRGWIMKCIVASVMLATMIFSYSRTYMLCAMLAFISTLGMFNNSRRRLLWVLIFAALIAGGTSYLYTLRNIGDIAVSDQKFETKILNSIDELIFTSSDDERTAQQKWRGFEVYSAWREFQNSSFLEQIFGRGFGATVDLQKYVQLTEDMVYRFLPTLHNGFFYVLVKYGAVGLLLYALFLLGVLRGSNGWKGAPRGNLLSDMRIGLGLIMVLTSIDITGLFNKVALDGICIFLGAMYGYCWAQGRRDQLGETM